MIAAEKYMDLGSSVIVVGATVLKVLQHSGVTKYDEVLERVVKVRGEHAKETFAATLSFLFLIGKVNYLVDIDSLELNI